MGFAIRRAFVLAALALTAGSGSTASAQTLPDRPIRMIVPTTPGSPTDVMARLVAQAMSAHGHQVIVEPRPGGGGIIGTRAVIAAEPDGTTLLFTEGAKHLMTPALYDNVGFNPVTDLIPVATAGRGSFVLVISPAVPAATVKELVHYARANPGKLNFGFGQGTLPHMLGELLKGKTRVDINSVPYKGGAQAVTDMLGGHIQMNFGTTATLLPLIKQGKVRALAVTNDQRVAELPDVPTMAESGYINLTLRYWMGIWAPPRTPRAIVEKLNEEVGTALDSPALLAGMATAGFQPMPMGTKSLVAFVKSESPKWLQVAKQSGVKGD